MLNLVIRKRKWNLKVSYDTIIWFLLLVWTFEPQYLRENYMPALHDVFVLGRLVAAGLLCFIVFYHWYSLKDYRPSAFMLFICIEQFILVFASILNDDANPIMQVIFNNAYLTIPFCAGLDYALQRRTASVIRALLFICEILVYGNLLSVLLNPNGLYNIEIGNTRKYYLLGQQNQAILYILIAFVVSLIYSQYIAQKRISFRTLTLIVAGVYTEIIFQSATGLVGLFVFAAIFLFTEFKNFYIDLRWGLIASFAIYLIFIVFKVQEIFSDFLINVLNRDITASTRTTVWAKALEAIAEKPILGYGVEEVDLAISRFGYVTPHNRFLYFLYRGGAVLLIAFIIMVIKASQKLLKKRTERASAYITSALFALLLQIQFESYDSVLFYIIFIMAFHVERITLIIQKRPFCKAKLQEKRLL